MSSLTLPRQVADLAVRVRPARPDEYDRLVARVAAQAGPTSLNTDALLTTMRQDPRFVPDHLRLVEIGDDDGGMLLLVDRQVRLGSALVRCAILMSFGVAPAAEVPAMRDMLRLASAQGFLLALRWMPQADGDQGFGPGQKRYTVVLSATTRPFGDTGYTLRPATAADAGALLGCYEAATASTTLAEIRSDEPWQWRAPDPLQYVVVAVDPLGDVRGYVRLLPDSDPLYAPEIAVLDDGPAPALFDYLLRLAAGREAHIAATPDHRWSRWAFAHGASHAVSPGDGRGALRVLDLRGLLQAAQPELQRRVQQSEFAAASARLRLETPPGSVGLVVDGGRLAFDDGRNAALVTLPWAALNALISGYRDAESLAGQPGVRIEGAQTLRLLQVLFPEQQAHWSPPACF